MKTSSPRKKISLRLALFSTAVASLSPNQSAFAASAAWTAASGGAFATGSNWSTGAAPGSTTVTTNTDTATFNLGTGGTVTVDTGRNLENFTFDTAVGSYTFSGGSLLLTTGGTTQLASTVTSTGQTESFSGTPITVEGAAYTFSNNATTSNLLSLGAIGAGVTAGGVSGSNKTALTLTFSGANTGANTVSGAITDFNTYNFTAVTKSGAGTWLFTGANSYAGATMVSGGILQFSGANGANAGASTYTLNAGGSLVIDNTTAAGGNNNARIADTSAIALNGGSFIFNGADAAGTNSTETVGALTAGLGGNSVITVNAGGSNTATLTAASFVRAVGTNVGAVLINGTGLGSSATASNRFLSTSAPAILLGTTAATTAGINAGVLNTKIVPFVLGEATATTGGLGTATGTANTFLTYNATTGFRPLNLTDEFAHNTITATDNTDLTSGTTASATTVSINSLIINGGALTIADGTTLTNASGALLFSGNGSIQPAGTTGIYSPSAAGTNSGAENQITVNSGMTGTIGAIVTGTGGLTKNGAGTLVLTGVNTYTGTTSVINGTLQLATGATLSPTTATNSLLYVANGSVLDLHGANVTANNNTNSNTASVTLGANATILNNGTGTSTLTASGSAGKSVYNLQGTILDNNNSGTGKVALVLDNLSPGSTYNDSIAGNNSYSGGTFIYGNHQVRTTTATAFGTGTVNLFGGANVLLQQAAGTVANNYVFNSSNALEPTLVGTAIQLAVSNATTFSGTLSGNGTVSFTSGAPTFAGSLSGFTGTLSSATTSSAGIVLQQTTATSGTYLIDGSSANFAQASAEPLSASSVAGASASAKTATTVLMGSLTGIAGATLQNNTANNVATFQIGSLGTASSYAGVIKDNTGNTALALQGGTATGTTSPTLTLTGTNTYTGGTTVNSGTLLVNNTFTTTTQSGTGTGAVNVNGGTLGGTGQITGLLTVTSGANLSPGATNVNDIGTFTARGGVALNGTYVVDLGTTAASTDLTTVVGALTLNATTSMLNVRSLASGAATGTTYEILTSSTALNTTFANLANGALYTDAAGDTFTVNYNDMTNTNVLGDVSLTLDSIGAVPEPSTWISGVLMLGMVGLYYRRTLWRVGGVA